MMIVGIQLGDPDFHDRQLGIARYVMCKTDDWFPA